MSLVKIRALAFFRSFRNGMLISKKAMKLFSDFDDAQEVASDLDGAAVQVYAREVENDD